MLRRPVGEPRLPHHVLSREQAPRVRVAGVGPIVTQNEVLALAQVPDARVGTGVRDVGLVNRSTVDPDPASLNADLLTRKAHDALDVVFARADGRGEDDHVAALR